MLPRTTTPTSLVDLLFNDDLVGRCLVAPDGTVRRANSEWLRSTGLELDDVLGADIIDLFPDTRDVALAMHERARAGHRVDVPRRRQVLDGRETWWEGSVAPVPMDGGTGLLITAREVSGEAARADPAATALADYFHDVGPAGIVLFEPAPPFRVLVTNKAYQDLWPEPLRSRGLVGLGLAEFVERAEESGVAEIFRTVARTGVGQTVEEFAYEGFPGGTRWFHWTLSPVVRSGRVVALANMAVDITREVQARRDADAAAAESRHAAELLEFGEPFCELDREFRVIRVNAAHERINGHRREEVLGRTHWEVWPESADPSSPYWREYHRCMAERVRVEFEAHYTPLDVWTGVAAHPTAEGGIAIFWRDVTARKRVEQELKRSEASLREVNQRFQAALQASPIVVFTQDRELRYTWVANAGLYRAEEVLGRTDRELMERREDAERLDAMKRRAMSTGEPVRGTCPVHRAGVTRWYDVHVQPQRAGAEVVGIIGTSVDVTQSREAQDRIATREAHLRLAMEASLAIVFEWDIARDRVTRVRSAEDALPEGGDSARTLEEVAQVVHPEDREQFRANVRAAMHAADGRYHSEFRIVRADGDVRWLGESGRVEFDPEGRPLRLVGISLDVTERKRMEDELRNSEARFRVLADGTPIMIWSTDAMGRMLFVNRAYCEFFGVTQEVVTAHGWQPLVHPEDAPGYVEAYAAAMANRAPFHAEARVRRADGEWRWVESFAQPQLDADGKLVSMTGSSPDVTDRKRAAEGLQQADRQKTEFLAVLSHELRNPLAPIKNAVLLLDRAAAESATARRAKDILRRQTDQLARLVDDLLDLSRITYGKLHVELAPADARELVRRAYADAKALYDQREVDLALLDSADPLWIEADPARFAQMLGNLLHNALKFTGPGGVVQLRLSRRGSACEISVKDSGQGLAGADLERIFDPFEQGQSPRTSAGGLGLGLALVKRIVAKHRGTVRARSDGPGKGAEFVIDIPLATSDVGGTLAHTAVRRSGARAMRVLVVEDNEDAAATLADLLSLGGHTVNTVSTGAAAVSAVAADAPDVLICDIGLPDMSGYDVIKAVRASENGHRVFAVALTGYAQPQDRDEALAAGFDAHLPKPPPLDELDALLAQRFARGPG